MSEDVFPKFLRLGVIVYWAALPAVQWVVFSELEQRGAKIGVRSERTVRDEILHALLRGALLGLLITLPIFAVWAVRSWPSLHLGVLLGGEILLVFVVLAIGLAALAARLGLSLMEKVSPGEERRALFLSRLSVLGAGAAYGIALWLIVPGGPGEMLFAVFALGVAMIVLGLNRTTDMSPELLARLSEAMKKR